MSKNILSYHHNHNSSSFTLIELLIVIAILAILMSVVVIAINPAEIMKRARDSQRISDLANLGKVLSMALSEGLLTSSICDGTKIYASLPDSIPLSNNLPSGFHWQQVSEDNLRKSDGTGWIPINLSGSYTSGFSLASLPVDPSNTLNDGLYYTFYCNPQQQYILTSYMESKTFGPKGNETSKTNKDGGPDPYLYEVGSNLFISPLKPVGSWSFDEGTGTIANDSSGNNNNGTLYGPTWTEDGQVNKALSFDGVNDYVKLLTNPIDTNLWSIEMWFNIRNADSYDMLYSGPDNVDIQLFFDKNSKYLITSVENVEKATSFKISDHYNEWHHVIWTHNNSYYTIVYIDGEIVLDTTDTNYIKSYETVSIGNVIGSSSYGIDGFLDEVRIYNRALSTEEIKRHYEMSK